MAIPFEHRRMQTAQSQAAAAQQIADKAGAMAAFLQTHLVTGAGTHRVEVEAIAFGSPRCDVEFRTPFGPVWGRFRVVREEEELYGLLELLLAERNLQGSITLIPVHKIVFDRHGNASFDASLVGGWDWDFEGEIIPEAEAARTFARVLTLKVLESLPSI